MLGAKITHIFSSVQGEGIFVGQPQIFIRFAKCNLDCDFCDAVKKGGKDYGVFELLDAISAINSSMSVNTISITGGEPLLYVDFLKAILPQLKKRNFKIYLETNGTLPGNLKRILDYVDIIAMDMKLPSAHKKQKKFWSAHRDFLNIAKKKNIFVKVVVTNRATREEMKKVIEIIDDADPKIPLVIQPVTPARRVRKKISLARLFEFQTMATMVLDDVRVIPQIHKMLGVQ